MFFGLFKKKTGPDNTYRKLYKDLKEKHRRAVNNGIDMRIDSLREISSLKREIRLLKAQNESLAKRIELVDGGNHTEEKELAFGDGVVDIIKKSEQDRIAQTKEMTRLTVQCGDQQKIYEIEKAEFNKSMGKVSRPIDGYFTESKPDKKDLRGAFKPQLGVPINFDDLSA